MGYYSLASQLAERLTLATGALYNASAAQIGGSARPVAAKLTTRVVRLTLLVLLPVTVLMGVLGIFAIPFSMVTSFVHRSRRSSCSFREFCVSPFGTSSACF